MSSNASTLSSKTEIYPRRIVQAGLLKFVGPCIAVCTSLVPLVLRDGAAGLPCTPMTH